MASDSSEILTLTRLPRARETEFALTPEAGARTTLARALDLGALRKLRFAGRLIPEGKHDWRLEATLGATVEQPCVITAEPVTTRIDTPVIRRYIEDLAEPEAEEVEMMPEDESLDPLPATLDLSAVMEEALALALPLYPRAPGADLGQAVFAGPGVAPMTDEEAKPLAGLATLKAQMEGKKSSGDDGES